MNSGTVLHNRVYDTAGRMVRYPLGEYLRDLSYDAANRITGYTHYAAAPGATAGSSISAAPAQDQQFSYDNLLWRLTQAITAQATWAYRHSDAREWTDQNVKGDPASASRADQAATLSGVAELLAPRSHVVLSARPFDRTV